MHKLEKHTSHKNTQITVEASWREKTVTMDQEKEVQWIKNYSELYESESVNQSSRKTERILTDISDLCCARKTEEL